MEQRNFRPLHEYKWYNWRKLLSYRRTSRFLPRPGNSNPDKQQGREGLFPEFNIHLHHQKEGGIMDTRTGQTKRSDLVLELLHAEEEKDFDKVERYLTNDFIFAGPIPKPIGKKEYIETRRQLFNAFPDWRFNFSLIKEDENEVTGKIHVTGTHTRDLQLTIVPNLGTVRATGKKVSLPEAKVHLRFQGNKISRFDVEQVPNGGAMGLLSQIGVDVHALV